MRDSRLIGAYPLQGKDKDKAKTMERIIEKLDSMVACNGELIANLCSQVQQLQSEVHKNERQNNNVHAER